MLFAMIARRLRPAPLGALLMALVAFALAVAACDKVPLTAPTESTISLFATASSISATGSTDIVATVIESAGTPVQNGTVVTFTTTLGRIDPLDARTQNGKVTVKLSGDGRSGTATITAFSGGAISEQLTLPIGSAAAETVTLRAEPGRLPPGGGSTQIIALVRDAAGNPLPGASVAFSASAGNLSSGVAVTDGNGEARTTLTTGRETTITAAVGSKTAQITLSIDGALELQVTVTPDPPVAGRSATFSITVRVPTDANPVQRVTINFGDGESRSVTVPSTGGATTIAHTYQSDGTFTVTVTATDTAGNTQTQQMVVAVQPAPPVTVSVTGDTTLTVGQIVIFTATASAGTGATVTRYEWDLDDGTTQTTTANSISHSYGSVGQKVVRVKAIASDGSEGTAQLVVVVS
jgi:adhesin/invasin